MNRKLFYMLVIFCSISIFSSAKQNGKKCGKENVCTVDKQNNSSAKTIKENAKSDFNVSPTQLLIMGI
jgi:hypothetical protein